MTLASGESSDVVCAEAEADTDLGVPGDWAGRSAGGPEKSVARYGEEQVALDPQWSINLEGLPAGAVPGSRFPGDIFFRKTDDGLCVIDVAWVTLESAG